METLTRLVSESLARHGFDRPLDYRRLQWSRWFRCESHHSLLSVPSKPGVFALAEEIMDLAPVKADNDATDHVGTAAVGPAEPGSAAVEERSISAVPGAKNEAALAALAPETNSRKPGAESPRMLAVTRFFEDDDMAFVLDRMLSHQNPMRTPLSSGRYFVRYVVIEDQSQRRSICSALNQWIASSAEKATGIGAHFASSLEITTKANESGVPQFSPPLREVEISVDRTQRGTNSAPVPPAASKSTTAAPQLDSGAATNIHCPSPFPSGF